MFSTVTSSGLSRSTVVISVENGLSTTGSNQVLLIDQTSAVLDDVTVCTKVKNESAYPLHESVEVYVKYKNAQPDEPGFQLKGIACVELQAGEEKEVSVTLHARDFAVITEDGGCVVRPGEYEISIGGQQPGERSRALTGRETEILTVRKEGNEENVEY